ncbi:multiple sugar transport system substrate-binding protein [Catenulispora sp. MAP12-49]|uniref:extracellular solute-binding protein n=1 Tax=Catenulispora sp. MAP12-49 TaxID=3156302 RepID=UPI003512E1C1
MKSVRARRITGVAGAAAVLVTAAACGSSGPSKASGSSSGGTGGTGGATSGVTLQVLIGSSGDAETNAVVAAGNAWAAKTGNKVVVTPAKDLTQQLTQSLAGGTPPDIFYVDASKFQSLVKGNALADVGEKITDSADMYPNLQKAFTASGQYYCVPKDFSTLALEINTDLWTKAGLTDADYPKTWDQLETVAKKLTGNGVTGLVMSDTLDRIGAFMRQAGGSVVSADGKTVTADSPQNLQALDYLQKLGKEGALKFPKQVDTGWGGEALGKGKAAMTIEGNWIVGSMQKDYPNVHYKVVPLPAGPAGNATLSFTNCWGVAQKSAHQAAAVDFVDYLTTVDQQMSFAKAFGVMPSRQAAKTQFTTQFPDQAAFVTGADNAFGPVGFPGFDAVQKDFDAKIQGLSDGSSDPKSMLSSLQKNASDALSNN